MKYILGLNGENLNYKVDFIDNEVGMIRGEYLCITKKAYFGNEIFCSYFVNYLKSIANVYNNKDVYYRMADLTSGQMNFLNGAINKFQEKYYMDGYRGIRRAFKFTDELELEISCFVKAWEYNNNLALLVPFVSSVDEVVKIRKILDDKKYTGKLAIMVETPACCMLIDKILDKVKLDRLVVGLNDLSSFMLASNRHLKTYSVNNMATYEMIKLTLSKIKKYNIEIVLGGYVESDTAKFYEKLGIDKMIVHYHLLPKIISQIDQELFVRHYNEINKEFKEYRENNKILLKGIEYLND